MRPASAQITRMRIMSAASAPMPDLWVLRSFASLRAAEEPVAADSRSRDASRQRQTSWELISRVIARAVRSPSGQTSSSRSCAQAQAAACQEHRCLPAAARAGRAPEGQALSIHFPAPAGTRSIQRHGSFVRLPPMTQRATRDFRRIAVLAQAAESRASAVARSVKRVLQ